MFYRVNMADLSVKQEEKAQYQGLGGRALSARIIAAEVDSGVHPLSAENRLVFVTGLLTGTGVPNTDRMSLGAKSPLTGAIKESNVGGNMGYKLGRLGIRGIIIEDLPQQEATYVLKVSATGIAIHDMPELKGLNIYDTVAKLHNQFGADVAIGCIGTAGENKMASACVGFTDGDGAPTRQAGRGGIGAVMASKGIKAIVGDDSGICNVQYADAAAFQAGAHKLANALLAHHGTGQAVPTADVNMPFNDHQRRSLTGELEHVTEQSFGLSLGIDNVAAVALMNRLCDDYGVDAIEIAVALGVVMEAGVANFGDSQAAINLIDELGRGTFLGRILGAGAEVAGKVFGVRRVPVVKGQGIPAYDPRAAKGMGVTYATSAMGADHTAGYSITPNIMHMGDNVDPLSKEGQVDLSRMLQIATAFLDSTGLCLSVVAAALDTPAAMEGIVEMCNARYGWRKTVEDYLETGKQVLRDERAFNKAAGITDGADDLPDFFRTEPLAPHNAVYDISKDELNKVFDF